MAFPALVEVEGKLAERQKSLHEVFDIAGPEMDLDKVVKSGKLAECKSTRDVAAHIRELNDEMTELGKERDDLKAVEQAAATKEAHEAGADTKDAGGAAAQTKSVGELFVKSQAFGKNTPEVVLDIDLKTLLDSSTGWVPESTRTGKVVDFATRPIQVADIIPTTTTGQNAVTYMEETTFTNNAAETAEGGPYPESALSLTERSSNVRKISTFIPVTDEQLEDVPQVRGYLDNRLPFMIRQRLDSQILVGNGTAPNLRGILNVAGIQTQAKGTDPVPDAVYKAMVLVMTTGQAAPNAYVTNPLDWQDVRLLRTADGIYIWGNPSEAGPERIWGLRTVLAQALTVNTGLVGDFQNFVELAVKRGIEVQTSNSHSTFFVEGKQAVRASMRAALVVYRPAAFCTVTGI